MVRERSETIMDLPVSPAPSLCLWPASLTGTQDMIALVTNQCPCSALVIHAQVNKQQTSAFA